LGEQTGEAAERLGLLFVVKENDEILLDDIGLSEEQRG
jgi:hypothetical protein